MTMRREPVGIYPTLNTRLVLDLAINVRDYGASGSSSNTTGSIASGSATLTLAAAEDFQNGQGIVVFGAGTSGGLLVTTIENGGGTSTLTLANAAATTVSSAEVWHDDTSAIQAAITALGWCDHRSSSSRLGRAIIARISASRCTYSIALDTRSPSTNPRPNARKSEALPTVHHPLSDHLPQDHEHQRAERRCPPRTEPHRANRRSDAACDTAIESPHTNTSSHYYAAPWRCTGATVCAPILLSVRAFVSFTRPVAPISPRFVDDCPNLRTSPMMIITAKMASGPLQSMCLTPLCL